jgi:hypothetical protein
MTISHSFNKLNNILSNYHIHKYYKIFEPVENQLFNMIQYKSLCVSVKMGF